jgi:hypothetical protein
MYQALIISQAVDVDTPLFLRDVAEDIIICNIDTCTAFGFEVSLRAPWSCYFGMLCKY